MWDLGLPPHPRCGCAQPRACACCSQWKHCPLDKHTAVAHIGPFRWVVPCSTGLPTDCVLTPTPPSSIATACSLSSAALSTGVRSINPFIYCQARTIRIEVPRGPGRCLVFIHWLISGCWIYLLQRFMLRSPFIIWIQSLSSSGFYVFWENVVRCIQVQNSFIFLIHLCLSFIFYAFLHLTCSS